MAQPERREPLEMADPMLADFAAADRAALDALYDFERFEAEGIVPDDAATRVSLVLWHMHPLERAVNRCLHADTTERALTATERNALLDVLRGHDAAAARVEAAYRRLADAGATGEGEGVPA